MKAKELLKLVFADADLAAYGDIVAISADASITHWFGESAKLVAGSIRIDDYESDYLAIYESVDRTYGFVEKHPADAVVRTDDDKIYLWRIEDGDVD